MGGKSIGLTKGLPYFEFMRHVIYDITVRGQLDQMKSKWKIKKPNCAPLKNTGKPLSLKKLSSIFIFIQCGSRDRKCSWIKCRQTLVSYLHLSKVLVLGGN